MITWTFKQLRKLRSAIAGRNHPRQLAWAVAMGLVLGLVPHGNLLAVGWLLLVLTLNINHAMAGVTAIAGSFAAGYLDPYSHRVGQFLLDQPRVHDSLAHAWRWPLIPWTDLNNTVVLGSFTITIAALLPVFIMTYPVFRFFRTHTQTPNPDPAPAVAAGHSVIMIDQAHGKVPGSKHRSRLDRKRAQSPVPQSAPAITNSATTTDTKAPAAEAPVGRHVAVETRIDVIRMSDYRDQATANSGSANKQTVDTLDPDEPLDEAFRYLLHQLRDTQQRKAA